ncbi:MAG TPA: hypothetical protein VK565_02705, partial [Gemmatimonadaceae bacterium]|nr:hypothetical protein [Gemmatimonadaceae bacterium]
ATENYAAARDPLLAKSLSASLRRDVTVADPGTINGLWHHATSAVRTFGANSGKRLAGSGQQRSSAVAVAVTAAR